jgi:hypothetical protein
MYIYIAVCESQIWSDWAAFSRHDHDYRCAASMVQDESNERIIKKYSNFIVHFCGVFFWNIYYNISDMSQDTA